MDRWLSFGDITTIANEPGPGIEPHFARLKWGILCTEKGEKEGMWTMVLLTQGLHALARRKKNVVPIELLLIDRVMINC